MIGVDRPHRSIGISQESAQLSNNYDKSWLLSALTLQTQNIAVE